MFQAPIVSEKSRRGLGRLLAAVAGAFLLIVGIYVFGFLIFTFIPPILVRVVDAVSGEPIGGIAVTQNATLARSDGPSRLQTETKMTGSSGYVLFRPHLYTWPVFAFHSYSISINQNSLAAKPWHRDADPGLGQSDKYLPMSLVASCAGCEMLWRAPNPETVNLRSLWSVTAPLIPALDSPDKCSSIANPTISKQCQQLSTYRSAFVHFDSVQDVENNKAICRQLEPLAAKSCLDDLAGYIYHGIPKAPTPFKDSSPYIDRPMPMLPALPLQTVLPFDVVGGLAVTNRRSCCNNAFTGSVTYIAEYGLPHRMDVTVEDLRQKMQPKNRSHHASPHASRTTQLVRLPRR